MIKPETVIHYGAPIHRFEVEPAWVKDLLTSMDDPTGQTYLLLDNLVRRFREHESVDYLAQEYQNGMDWAFVQGFRSAVQCMRQGKDLAVLHPHYCAHAPVCPLLADGDDAFDQMMEEEKRRQEEDRR